MASRPNGLRSSWVPLLRGSARQENARNREPCYLGPDDRNAQRQDGGVKPPLRVGFELAARRGEVKGRKWGRVVGAAQK
jgi:hypothetical protein